MPTRSLSVLLLSCAVASAHPGKATAVWISSSATAEPGKPLQTAIRMTHDKGWHSYWIKPGKAGIPTSVEWKLPPVGNTVVCESRADPFSDRRTGGIRI